MLRPIQSLCLVADERDTELVFAAGFAAEEIARLSDLRRADRQPFRGCPLPIRDHFGLVS